jgi:hypothetical protein
MSIMFVSCIRNSSSSRSFGFFGGIAQTLVVSSVMIESQTLSEGKIPRMRPCEITSFSPQIFRTLRFALLQSRQNSR